MNTPETKPAPTSLYHLSITAEEKTALLNLIHIATKAEGLNVAVNAVLLAQKISATPASPAIELAQPSVKE